MSGLDALFAREALPQSYRQTTERVAAPLARRLAQERRERARPIAVGLCGSQGSGKSTLAGVVAKLLETQGLKVAVLSIDDLYLDRKTRRARALHPLMTVRGPPGSHDVALGLELVEALLDGAPGEIALPRFDKALESAVPPAEGPWVRAPVDVVILEGWMVGARPQADEALQAPINALEREEDADGRWRRSVNAALAGAYQPLWTRLDLLVFLQAPNFEAVFAWRRLQETKLADRLAREHRPGETMDDTALTRFIAHYERLTRWMLEDLPRRADIVVRLGEDHAVLGVNGLESSGAGLG